MNVFLGCGEMAQALLIGEWDDEGDRSMTYGWQAQDDDYDWQAQNDWEYEQKLLRLENDEVLLDCDITGDCICPEELTSLYSYGGIAEYIDECPVHGIDGEEDDGMGAG
jgi:hypothetical protein